MFATFTPGAISTAAEQLAGAPGWMLLVVLML
jgi:hypothetical protein